jgi:hypothetical protein
MNGSITTHAFSSRNGNESREEARRILSDFIGMMGGGGGGVLVRRK